MTSLPMHSTNSFTVYQPPMPHSNMLRVERDGDGQVIVSHDATSVHGVGDTLADALADFAVAAREFQNFYEQNLERLAPPLIKQLDDLNRLLDGPTA